MYLLIITLPLIGTILSGLFGNKIGAYSAMLITVTSITISFILSCIAFYEVALQGSPCYIEIFKWFDSEMISFSWGFLFDTLTVTMLIVVTSISTCVHIYSTEYMSADPHIQRFMAYLSFFTFFMLILVTADNFFQMFLGWEGVGLCSYLLINFWYGRIQANKAALKAIIVNRIGDIGLALGIFTIYYTFNSIDYSTVFALTPSFKNHSIIFFGNEINVITLICFFFFIGATGKSAQVGLHTWLPDAMEGPTPVSALIHAATMVTAGVFLIVRCSPMFEYAPTISWIITISGAMTAFIAASIGLVQNDLKRVIAYSTCSQLGYMMIACGTSGYAVGMFHLTNHAFFKALLFLSAGSIIHALADEQDMRKMGGLLNLLPFTYSMMFIGSLSLMGFPFLTGFYSKDLILEWTYSQYSINGTFAYWLGSISAFLTAFYSMRVLSLTFLKKPLMNKVIASHAHEPYYTMTGPLFFLSICSIFIGYVLKDMMVGLGTDFWGNAIFVLPENALLLEAEFLDTNIKIFPVILSLCGGSIAFIMYNHFFNILYRLKLSFIGRKLYTFFNRKWFFDKVYNEILAQHTLTVAYEHGYQNIDRGIIELLGPNGVWILFSPISNSSNYLSVYHLEILKKLRNFFKILFITFIFIYFIIFGYWFLNDYTQYINFFFNKNTDITPIDFFSQKENFFISNFISDIQFNSSWVDQLNNIINNSLNTGDSLGLNFLAQYFNIDYFAIDLNKLEKPYLPFSEKWVDNLDYFRNNIPVHDENGVFIAQNYTNFVNQFLSKDLH
jgi:NADH-ubiquinone oxidoreductase chain 5